MLRFVNAFTPLFRYRGPAVTQPICGLKGSVEEKLGLPQKPKRPSPAFVRFLEKSRGDIIKKNPSASPKDIVKIGSELWKSSSEATKNSLKEEYKKDYEKYSYQMSKYNESLTPKQQAEIKEALTDLKDQKEKKQFRKAENKRSKELGKPTKPLPSFFLYAQSELHTRGDTSVTEFYSKLSKKWNDLPEQAREKYNAQALKAKETYARELETWEKKMIKLGNLDVVRQKTLEAVSPKKPKGE